MKAGQESTAQKKLVAQGLVAMTKGIVLMALVFVGLTLQEYTANIKPALIHVITMEHVTKVNANVKISILAVTALNATV